MTSKSRFTELAAKLRAGKDSNPVATDGKPYLFSVRVENPQGTVFEYERIIDDLPYALTLPSLLQFYENDMWRSIKEQMEEAVSGN